MGNKILNCNLIWHSNCHNLRHTWEKAQNDLHSPHIPQWNRGEVNVSSKVTRGFIPGAPSAIIMGGKGLKYRIKLANIKYSSTR